ncbi:MAG: cell division protein FtsW [Candidatus Woykebacteria bacterium RIFCSPHIGHO2_12_FULL_43_10]|uniref:Probable peptidoglycan glycosyltransferase FtsW n=2 Tax=Candidatus Woykeibacteriota TaxID=1817899 RepID=A0A1G1WZ57_9BACT|nr:MAG: cell division protein FtsW [Candidatus Woykebacteria bacterium RIFCSPHIGHO2_01_FULL_43_29]OGY29023.1 MAG: cell division protein FtsW [Candidatus Woykebacteria bacterium RIFCSPHIGHO2_12_FULL_43_10]OGY29109.1 MAG: cell division protein FtsW [Candidatus Woykebacteria bacterium RIFCSPHIGHO2_02_FULL_43_16b]OGY32851.1 MAG: cell division protein FtsW [Candidatus Woykebacteria bacterium RIFCSPLOWO2_01_FULL_43_14]
MIFLTLALVIFGVVMVYNASIVTAQRDFGDKYYFLKNQLLWSIIGGVVFAITSRIDYHYWQKFSLLALIGSVLLLLAVFIPGLGVKTYGAHRWLNLGFASLQPAEITKMALILYLSTVLTKKIQLTNFVFVSGLILGIVLLQRDMGTTIILGTIALSLYFVAGAPMSHFFVMVPSALLAGAFFIISSDFRRARFLSFINPNLDTQGASYHINQILIALGSGGFFGLGLGQSRQKYGFIPEVSTDSIFAVIGEELGFIGAAFLTVLFLLLILRCFLTAKRAKDSFGFLMASGISVWIAAQAFINLSSMTALTPLTGVPLPFISYGGTSLVVAMGAVGLLYNISKQSNS